MPPRQLRLHTLRLSALPFFRSLLVEGVCATGWLDEVLTFLRDSEHAEEVNNRYIILDQAGCLDRLANLFLDDDIDEELKDIADGIGLDLREELRDKRPYFSWW